MAILSLPSLFPLLSWRNAALVLALLNLKNLPFAWHFRLIYHFLHNLSGKPVSLSSLENISNSSSSIHPVFAPVSIFSRSPILETDYNLHKSNSTYFSDLDVSRTALVTKLYSPGFKICNAQLEAQGHRGKSAVILGAVHASFRKEIAPYEKYEVRSRVLGWDRKWLIIGSWFIRPAPKSRRGGRSSRKAGKGTNGEGKEVQKGEAEEGEVVLACAVSKYVFKKGRFTIPPEQGLRAGGWLPEKSESSGSNSNTESSSSTPNHPLEQKPTTPPSNENDDEAVESSAVFVHTRDGQEEESGAGLTEGEIPETLSKILSRETINLAAHPSTVAAETPPPPSGDDGVWDWASIDKERLRGIELVKAWMTLDAELLDEFSSTATAAAAT